MRFSPVVVLLVSSFAFASAISAQLAIGVSVEEAPVLTAAQPVELLTDALSVQQPAPAPPAIASGQPVFADPGSNEERFRAEIKRLSQNKRQFIHCKPKNGKVLTRPIRIVNDKGFLLQTQALNGTYLTYADIAEFPKAVPAVGTRIKQGAQWTCFGVAIAVALPALIPILPLIMPGVIADE